MNMNARIVGETFRHDDCLPLGGTGQVWGPDDLPLGPPLAASVLRPEHAAGPRAGRAEDAARPEEPEAAALTAIMSRYEDARARIISADAPPSGPNPTVPVDLGPGLPRLPQRARPALAGDARLPDEATTRHCGPVRSLLSRLATALR